MLAETEQCAHEPLTSRQRPQRVSAQVLLALIKKHSGQTGEVKKLLEKATKLQPDFIEPRLELRGDTFDPGLAQSSGLQRFCGYSGPAAGLSKKTQIRLCSQGQKLGCMENYEAPDLQTTRRSRVGPCPVSSPRYTVWALAPQVGVVALEPVLPNRRMHIQGRSVLKSFHTVRGIAGNQNHFSSSKHSLFVADEEP